MAIFSVFFGASGLFPPKPSGTLTITEAGVEISPDDGSEEAIRLRNIFGDMVGGEEIISNYLREWGGNGITILIEEVK